MSAMARIAYMQALENMGPKLPVCGVAPPDEDQGSDALVPGILTNVSPGNDPTQHPGSGGGPVSQREATILMSVIFLLITASTLVAGVFLAAFIKAVHSGQFDDDRSPAVRILNDTPPSNNEIK